MTTELRYWLTVARNAAAVLSVGYLATYAFLTVVA